MSCELAVDDIVTEFLLNTCRMCPGSKNKHAVFAALTCGIIATGLPKNEVDDKCAVIPITAGSVVEFYIEPILQHIGDVDVMYHYNIDLAIPRGYPPPAQLPAEFHNYVQVMEIIDSHLPGHVYLELRYLLTECSDDDQYNAVEYDRGKYLSYQRTREMTAEVHGPAYVVYRSWMVSSVDQVPCLRCLLLFLFP